MSDKKEENKKYQRTKQKQRENHATFITVSRWR